MKGGRHLFEKFLRLLCFIVLFGLFGVLSGPVKEGVTKEVTWKKDDIVFPNETLATLLNGERDVLAKNDSSSCERKVHIYSTSVIVVSVFAGIELIILIVAVVLHVTRNSSNQYSRQHNEEPCRVQDPGLQDEEPHQGVLSIPLDMCTGRISYYELRKLVRYAFEEKEDDKLEKAMKSLMNNDNYVIRRSKYRSTDDQQLVYKDLCVWKKQCVKQIELLFEKCIDADMVESIRKLRDLRRSVSNVPGSFSDDLEGILLHIGRESKDNITNLLRNLNVEIVDCDRSSGLEEIVKKALQKLDKWQKGLVPINPVVMLSLTLEDLGLSTGEEKFFQGPEEKSSPNSQDVNRNAGRHRKKKAIHQPSTSYSINLTVDQNENDFPL